MTKKSILLHFDEAEKRQLTLLAMASIPPLRIKEYCENIILQELRRLNEVGAMPRFLRRDPITGEELPVYN